MKRKILLLMMLLVGVFIFSKRYELYYFFQGKEYLRPNESIELAVRPKYEQIEYSSDLYLESDEKVLLKLEGRDTWHENCGWTYKNMGDIGYRYSITERVIKKYDSNTDNGIIVATGHKGATIDGDGIIVPLKGKRKYSVTEDHDYTITITNLSDQPVAFYARVSDR
ncbi:TPA: hypothetical protein TUO09_001157 [Streptococcus equi subsp. zooepidemicus]|uniref:Uncharacterized protein n=2 Tax=Streptococcus equi TaxID=1336 RepID=A0A922NUV5_9STRE|nr:hypothetical protein [Streptococcus equi]HEL0164884.1 hypothetical protein [Streptococcus equi subsp. zooepidemicus]HEL1012677.1 hypothetical protein [Streptococcus equi subsp. ruminatorum]KED04448.1 hypothetical protein CECT5772_05583 [Streptococcus equi subsp. ruminatorum CECT 5772]HEL0170543.1 hypothetical protein [Streptococcus equi subsp. zooepidemicus]HEL0187019.1 hypothetical protein [Streptococcus equi subsp. zooepidemicus]